MTVQISIVTPLYNRAKLVEQTIDSVRQQSFQEWELLIVDDHSTDQSLSRASQYANEDGRIKAWSRQAPHQGAPACRNEGLARAKGQWVLFLDSDDLLSQSCLENRLKKFKEHPEFDAHLFPSELFRKSPGDLGRRWFVPSQDYLTGFLQQPLWQTSAALWKIESINRVGGFREDLLAWQDWDLFVRCLIDDFAFCVHGEEPVDNYVRRSLHQRISQTAERDRESITNRQGLFRDTYRELEDREKLNPQRVQAMRTLCVELAIKMHLSGMGRQADDWIAELPSLGLIDETEMVAEQERARQGSRLNLRQRINERKLKLLQWTRR